MTRIEQRDWKKIRKHREKQTSDNQTSDQKPSRLLFRLKELRTTACFPTFQHRGFYFPPSASKDRAVNSMEIKDFIILWTYSQWRQAIVVMPPISPERETFRMLSICKAFAFLMYSTKTGTLSCDLPFSSTASLCTSTGKPIKLLLSWKKGGPFASADGG